MTKKFGLLMMKQWILALLFGCLFVGCKEEAKNPDIPYPDDAIVLSVEGMSCSGCKAKVTKALSKVDGVEWAQVEVEIGQVAYMGPAEKTDVAEAIEKVGYKVAQTRADSAEDTE